MYTFGLESPFGQFSIKTSSLAQLVKTVSISRTECKNIPMFNRKTLKMQYCSMLFDKTIFFSRMYHLYPVIIFNFF